MRTYNIIDIRQTFIRDIIETLIEKGYKRNSNVLLFGEEHFTIHYMYGKIGLVDYIKIYECSFVAVLTDGTEVDPFYMSVEELNYFLDAATTWVKDAKEKKQ